MRQWRWLAKASDQQRSRSARQKWTSIRVFVRRVMLMLMPLITIIIIVLRAHASALAPRAALLSRREGWAVTFLRGNSSVPLSDDLRDTRQLAESTADLS